MDANEHTQPPRRWLRRLLWMLCVVFVLFAGLLSAGYWAIGRSFEAPDWVRSEVEARLSRNAGDIRFRVGGITARVEEGWRPRLSLRDIDVLGAKGQTAVSLAHAETRLSMAALMRGQVQPATVRLSGGSLRLRRLRDGSFDLSFGEALAPVGTGASLGQLIKGLDAVLVRPEFAALRRVEADGLTLRYDDMRLARGWTVDGGRVRLSRAGDMLELSGDFALLGGGANVTTLEANYDSKIGETSARFGLSFSDASAQDISVHSPALAWLGALRAPISGAMRVGVDEAGQLGPLSATLQIGAGVLQPNEQTRPIPFDSARAYMTYAPEDQSLRFDDLSVVSKWVSARAEGTAHLRGIENGLPREFLVQFGLSEILANPDGLYQEAVQVEGADADFRLRLNPFDLQLGRMTIRDQGQNLHVKGRLRAAPEGWDLGLGGSMDAIAPERVKTLWPQRVKPRTRDWIADNIHKADLRDIEVAFRASPGKAPDLYLGFGFDGAEVSHVKTLPRITDAAGQASLTGHRFVVTAERGRSQAPQGGKVDVAGSTFVIPDVRIRETPAQLHLLARSTITAALSLLDAEPFRFLQKAGQPITLADGRADVSAHVDLLLVKKLQPEDVTVKATATLTNVRSDKVIPGRSLAAPRLAVSVAEEILKITGKGRVGQVPFDAVWTSPLGKTGGASTVAGTVSLSQGFADEFNIGLPARSLSGAAPARIAITLPRGRAPEFRLTSRLDGLGMKLAPLGWSKPRERRGSLEVSGQLASPPVINKLALEAPGLSASGKITLRPDGQLDSARFTRVRAGGWLDAPVVLKGRGRNAAPAVEVQGGTVDMRRTTISSGSGGSGPGGGPITLALDRLQISEGIALTGFRGTFDMSKGMDGAFRGRVNGAAPVTGRVAPRGGRSAFRIQSDDAGAVFAAAGLLKKGHKGTLDLTLLPAKAPGSYDGTLEVRKVWLREAPAMAALLNTVSVVGLLEQLGGSGILFNEVDASFRLTPTRVSVLRSSATGASLGISMDGVYDIGSGRMDMQGVFSPIYMLNGIGSILTRKGEGLIGFNYRLTGTAEKPRVQVNPLSILTPGMFRDIFRRPPPKVTQ